MISQSRAPVMHAIPDSYPRHMILSLSWPSDLSLSIFNTQFCLYLQLHTSILCFIFRQQNKNAIKLNLFSLFSRRLNLALGYNVSFFSVMNFILKKEKFIPSQWNFHELCIAQCYIFSNINHWSCLHSEGFPQPKKGLNLFLCTERISISSKCHGHLKIWLSNPDGGHDPRAGETYPSCMSQLCWLLCKRIFKWAPQKLNSLLLNT